MNTFFSKVLILLMLLSGLLSTTEPKEEKLRLHPHIYPSRPGVPSPYVSVDGQEIVTVQTREGFILLPVTQEDGDIYSCTYFMRGKGKQLRVDSGDFPSLARTGLHSEPELDQKKYITGRTVELINYIARPGRFSGTGFIGENEDILSVLKRDNRTVENLGLRHSQLAKPLFHVWNIILGEFLGSRYIGPVHVLYNDRHIVFNAEGGKGHQESIFHDEIEGKWNIRISRELTADETQKLGRSFPELTESDLNDLKNRLSRIRIGEMNPFYIMRYGFYEGKTDFRADPLAICFIFNLRPVDDIVRILKDESGG